MATELPSPPLRSPGPPVGARLARPEALALALILAVGLALQLWVFLLARRLVPAPYLLWAPAILAVTPLAVRDAHFVTGDTFSAFFTALALYGIGSERSLLGGAGIAWLREHAAEVFTIEAYRHLSLTTFDLQDAFFVPLTQFDRVVRPGPNVTVYRLKENRARGRPARGGYGRAAVTWKARLAITR